MADFAPSGPFEGLSQRLPRHRTQSRTSQYSARSASLRAASSSHNLTRLAASGSDVSQIHSPLPRRHHLLQTESHEWLHTPPHSPSSSRVTSPIASSPSQESPTKHARKHNTNLSFSSLMEQQVRRNLATQLHSSERKANEDSMGRRWLRWMHEQNLRQWVIPSAILATLWIKWSIGLGSYSGQGVPPMFGDYEAQRHWMEITIHLPIRQWYTYDLQYWGLDYPPLTAYVSWACGIIGSWFDDSWFALDKSRGIETPSSKVFMRASVLVLDALIYIPALVMFSRTWHGTRSKRTQNLALITLLLQPGLLLIDFGHFQYNSVMLGFTLLALNCFATGHDLMGAFFFVLSLGFKQMALYYAPAIGSYLLGKCLNLGPIRGLRLLIQLAIVTTLSFTLLFLPFLPPFAPYSAILDPITRIFPFNRGVFEDKVSNFWCASNVVFRWKSWASREALVKSSTILTAIGFAPGVVGLIQVGYKTRITSGSKPVDYQTPTLPLLPYALLTSSLSFFLFSFQVHEKTILLPLLPMTLLLSGSSPNSSTFEWGVLCNNVAVFSMWPLLKKDGQMLQYFVVTLLWNRVIGYKPLRSRPKTFIHALSLLVYGAIFTLHLLELIIVPPTRYPDLFPVMNVLISTPVFALTWLWSVKRGIEVWWGTQGLGSTTNSKLSPLPEGDVRPEGIRRSSGLRAQSLGLDPTHSKKQE